MSEPSLTPAAGTTTVTTLAEPGDLQVAMAADVVEGLTASPRTLQAKYFYDARGSDLFEDITALEEYYPTRTEASILEAHALDIVHATKPTRLVELGSGSSRKTRLLLEAMHRAGTGDTYAPLDVSESAVRGAAVALQRDYPWLTVEGYIADFLADVHRLPGKGEGRLVAFLGSTVGNLDRSERHAFFLEVASALGEGDHFLLGADLVKDPHVLVQAYDDRDGVTADFNRNILRVLNRELKADFPVEAFGHEAVWNAEEERIEMWLRASRPVEVRFPGLDLEVAFSCGDGIRTELSCKFRREGLEEELHAAGLRLAQWFTDERDWFSLSVVTPA